jgi:hypothetical protein
MKQELDRANIDKVKGKELLIINALLSDIEEEKATDKNINVSSSDGNVPFFTLII